MPQLFRDGACTVLNSTYCFGGICTVLGVSVLFSGDICTVFVLLRQAFWEKPQTFTARALAFGGTNF